MNKRILSLVLALVMVLGTFGTVFAASYDDVTGTDVATAVDRLSTLGILEGYPDGTFKPANSITRAEFAAVAARAKGLETVAQAAKGLATGFNDVPATHWASGYVGTAAKLGIVNGMGFGQFVPEAPVKYEDAVTMIVRALGYEAAAQAKGGYPYGYLIVANENGLLDDVKGTQGASATRGMVAQLTDNALEIPMMIQVGFGTDAKWVISGSKEHGDNAVEKYLLDELGFDSVKGRVVSVNTKTDKIIVDPTDEDLKNVTLEVAEGFDFYAVEGLETKFWYKNDTVEVYVVNEEAKFDAVEVDGDELVLVVEDENYEVARNATLTVNGEKVDQDEFEADYAKVVFNDDDEIIWAQGYTFDGFILVEEVEDEKALSFDDYDEVDLEDFTVVKEGKTISLEEIEEEDILFFNNDEEFAVVSNKGTEGELDRVYTDATFRFEGSAYANSTISTPLYFNDGKVGEIDVDILDGFLDDEETITVYVDFAGDVVVISGEVSSIGNSSYAALTADVVPFNGRKGAMIALDVRNGANEKVSHDLLVADLGDDIELTNISSATLQTLDKADDAVLKISVDKDGDVTEIELVESVELDKDFEIDDTNAKGTDGYSYKLQSSTVVFHDSNKKATTLGNAKDVFAEVKAGAVIFMEKGKVVAVIGETDADTDTKDVTGLVTGVKELTSGKLQFTVKVLGETQRIDTESKTLKLSDYAGYKDTIRTFQVGETSGEIKSFGSANSRTLTINSVSGRTINPTTGSAVELNTKVVIYNANDEFATLNLKDLKKDMQVTVYFQGSSNRFVDYVVANVTVDNSQSSSNVMLTNVNSADSKIEVEDANGNVKVYELTGTARSLISGTTVGGASVGDSIKLTFTSGRVTNVELVKTAAEIALEAEEKVVAAELAKVANSYQVAFSSTDLAADAKDLIEDAVNTDKVSVAVAHDAGSVYTVTLTSDNDAAVTATKNVTVTKKAASTDATLSAIRVNGVNVSDFSANKSTYTVTLNERPATNPTVTAVERDANASAVIAYDTADITNDVAATDTELEVTITVTAEKTDVTKVYTVIIKVPAAE